jgi:hypothetical protein
MAAIDDHIKEIESFRRAKNYTSMRELGYRLWDKLNGGTPKHHITRAKILYEFHMAAFQRYKDGRGNKAHELTLSLELAKDSRSEAEQGGDLAGMLFTDMNIYGHILPAMGKWQEGMSGIRTTLEKAQGHSTSPDAQRFERIQMNCLLFLIDFTVEHIKGNGAEVPGWLMSVEHNSVFQAECAKNPDWGNEYRNKVSRYIETK